MKYSWTMYFSTAQKKKFSIKDFFRKCDQIRYFPADLDLVTFTEKIFKKNFTFWAVFRTVLRAPWNI